MHGVMLWNNSAEEFAWERIERDGALVRYDVVLERVSALYTWQDNRCDAEFIASLPAAKSHLPVATGYGTATLFWMAKHKLQRFFAIYNFIVTIIMYVLDLRNWLSSIVPAQYKILLSPCCVT